MNIRIDSGTTENGIVINEDGLPGCSLVNLKPFQAYNIAITPDGVSISESQESSDPVEDEHYCCSCLEDGYACCGCGE